MMLTQEGKPRMRFHAGSGQWRCGRMKLHACRGCGASFVAGCNARACSKCRASALGGEEYLALAAAAHVAVARAIRHGDLPRPATLVCADCGKAAEHYDHRDYTRPLEVQAVCRGCNVRRGPSLAPARRS